MAASPDPKLTAPDRLKALTDSGLLDSAPEPDYDRITKLVCRILDVDVALFSVVAPDRQFFKSSCGLPSPWKEARQTPLSHSFCQHVVASDATLEISDAKTDPRVAGNRAIPDLGVAAYLGVPVHAPDGETLGALCAISDKPKSWPEDAEAQLRTLADIVETELRLRDNARRLAKLADDNALLAREYHHRVKNALSVSSALVTISGAEAKSVKDVVSATRERLSALADAHDSIMKESDAADLERLTARLLRPYIRLGKVADIDGPLVEIGAARVTPISLFLHELATNSAKYGAFAETGEVKVRWTKTDADNLALVWDEQSPSIKQSSHEGFGSTLIKIAAAQLGGQVDVSHSPGRIVAKLEFPLA